jgi:prepilin-type N-terminal cleavage/methylation domain-containing protein
MHNNKKAFTLIELLVVVLIIGILAAIALPQYYKAVRRSRSAEAFTILSAILTGQEEYFLIHGEYTNNIEDLSITIPSGKLSANMAAEDKKSNYYYACWEKRTCAAVMSNPDYPDFEFVGSKGVHSNGKKWCRSVGKNEKAHAICEMMGIVDSTFGGGNYYLLR